MHPATIIRPILGLLPSVLIMHSFGRAQRQALRCKRADVPISRVVRRRSLDGLLDFENYAPDAFPYVQRMRNCILLMVVVGFPAFAVAVFW